MPRDADCIFCKIVAREIPSSAVFETETVLAFLDVGPLAEGHLLVIPKQHYTTLVDVPSEDCTRLAEALPRLGSALMAVTSAEGFNVLQNNGKVAGQVVDHVHFHLIPRRSGDGLGYRWKPGTYPKERTEQLVLSYRASIDAQ